MTLVLNETYGFSMHGFLAFCENRFLRLYPVYYAVTALSLLHLFILGRFDAFSGVSIHCPVTLWNYITDASIIGQTGWDYSQMNLYSLAPNSWSLSIEICCYLILAAGCARNKRYLWMLLAAGIAGPLISSLAVHDSALYGTYNFQNHYGVIQAGFLPFALGGLAWHYRGYLNVCLRNVSWAYLLAATAANIALGFWSIFHGAVTGLYISSLLAVPTVIKLYALKPYAEWLAAADKLCGKLSYPMFISQWVIASMTAHHFFHEPYLSNYHFFAYLAGTLAFSFLMVRCVDEPIERRRRRIRESAQKLEEHVLLSHVLLSGNTK